MSIILGIHDGTHNAGACLISDGQIIAACDEERFTRVKNSGGFPTQSIQTCLTLGDINLQQITGLAFGGVVNPNPVLRLCRGVQENWKLDHGKFYQPSPTLSSRLSDWLQFKSPFPYLQSSSAFYTPLLRRIINKQLRKNWNIQAQLKFFDHHHCHASSAYFGSGFSEGLVIVADGLGDGLCLSVWKGNGESLRKIAQMPFPNSYGLLYSSITGYLGFRPFRHEGKLTGLSALGDADNIPLSFPFSGDFPDRKITISFPLHHWLNRLAPYSKEDISAWLQQGIEREITEIIRHYIDKTGCRNLTLAGGLFANVRLNQQLALQLSPSRIFIFPNMGDGGLSVGAGYLMSQLQGSKPKPFKTAFIGSDITEADILSAVAATGYRARQPDIAEAAATTLAEGGIIARCVGKMEYGPRALGNRSILAPAADISITKRLNQQLERSDFMPFAPIIRAECVEQYLEPQRNSLQAARWMTINFQAKPALKQCSPAIVHVDGSLRPQIIYRRHQPVLWKILMRYQQKTGLPVLINTSFNIHEEPIVRTAQEALRTFKKASLDGMILGENWIEAEH